MAGNPFVKGDKVWLHNAAVPRGHSKKLHRFWKGPYTVVDVLNNNVYKIKQDVTPHKQHTVHFDRLKPYVHRAEQREETSPSQQGDVPEDVPWEEKKADSGEKMEVEAESEDENYGMLVVRNRTAQLAPADTENQEPVEQEVPAGDNLENPAMEGDDMEPQQVEQVQLRRSNRIRQPPERLGSVTYF